MLLLRFVGVWGFDNVGDELKYLHGVCPEPRVLQPVTQHLMLLVFQRGPGLEPAYLDFVGA